jgi:hypothetical protein
VGFGLDDWNKGVGLIAAAVLAEVLGRVLAEVLGRVAVAVVAEVFGRVWLSNRFASAVAAAAAEAVAAAAAASSGYTAAFFTASSAMYSAVRLAGCRLKLCNTAAAATRAPRGVESRVHIATSGRTPHLAIRT